MQIQEIQAALTLILQVYGVIFFTIFTGLLLYFVYILNKASTQLERVEELVSSGFKVQSTIVNQVKNIAKYKVESKIAEKVISALRN